MFGWNKKKSPEAPPNPPEIKPIDKRIWNEDWQVGDIAECIKEIKEWKSYIPMMERPRKGQRYTVTGYEEGVG